MLGVNTGGTGGWLWYVPGAGGGVEMGAIGRACGTIAAGVSGR
jgi:hypothetical protein